MPSYEDCKSQVVAMVVREADGTERTVNLLEKCTRETILDPADAMKALLREFQDELSSEREHFVLLTLNTRRNLIKAHVVSVGTLDSSLVHPCELFRNCILDGAAALLVAHNHPSGDPEPSADDIAVTRRLSQAARLLGFALLDHMVVGSSGKFVSIRERMGHVFNTLPDLPQGFIS